MDEQNSEHDAKINRSRAEVGRQASRLLRDHNVVRAERADSPYDIRFATDTDAAQTGTEEGLLTAKVNRSRTEIGRRIFESVDDHGAVLVTQGDSEYDVQLYPIPE